jgi:hypothetical protein
MVPAAARRRIVKPGRRRLRFRALFLTSRRSGRRSHTGDSFWPCGLHRIVSISAARTAAFLVLVRRLQYEVT